MNSISYNPGFQSRTKFTGAVMNAYDTVMDTYDNFIEKRDNKIAVSMSNGTNSNKRAGAAAIGAATGLLNAALLFGVYVLLKKKPNFSNKIFDKFIVKKFDKWIARGKAYNPDSSKFIQVISGIYMKLAYSMLVGAATGYGWGLYRTIKNTNVNGKISHTRRGAQNRWAAEGLEELYKTEKGQLIIKNSIIKNPDKSVTVKFGGVGQEYTITKNELKKASKTFLSDIDKSGKTKGFRRKYSKGDGDILAVELAVEKYCKDILQKKVPYNSNVPLSVRIISKEGDILNTGGTKEGMFYLLTGEKVVS